MHAIRARSDAERALAHKRARFKSAPYKWLSRVSVTHLYIPHLSYAVDGMLLLRAASAY
jgi:hypothetical protein